MTSKLLALTKVCSVLVNFHDTSWHLFRCLSGKTYNFRQKIFDKWIHQQWKMFDSQRWKIFDTKIFDRKFSTQFFPFENIPPLINEIRKCSITLSKTFQWLKLPKEYFESQNKLQQYHKECWNNFDMKKIKDIDSIVNLHICM